MTVIQQLVDAFTFRNPFETLFDDSPRDRLARTLAAAFPDPARAWRDAALEAMPTSKTVH